MRFEVDASAFDPYLWAMPIDWDGLTKKLAGVAVKAGKRVVESGVDALLEDLDGALLEGRRRVKQARGRIPKKRKSAASEEPEVVDATPKGRVVDATLEDDA